MSESEYLEPTTAQFWITPLFNLLASLTQSNIFFRDDLRPDLQADEIREAPEASSQRLQFLIGLIAPKGKPGIQSVAHGYVGKRCALRVWRLLHELDPYATEHIHFWNF